MGYMSEQKNIGLLKVLGIIFGGLTSVILASCLIFYLVRTDSDKNKSSARDGARNISLEALGEIESQLNIDVVNESLSESECSGGIGEGTGRFRATLRGDDRGSSLNDFDKLKAVEYHVGQDELNNLAGKGFELSSLGAEEKQKVRVLVSENKMNTLDLRIETDCIGG